MSVDGSSPLDQALRLCGELSSAHQLDLIISLAKSLKKGAGGGRGGGSRKSAAASGVPKVKKTLSPGVAAWMAFVKQCKDTMSERFDGISKESEKLAIVKAIREEDQGAYAEFVAEFKASYVPSAPGSVASEGEESEAEEAAPPPAAKKASGAGASAKDAPKKAAPAPKPAASPSASAAEPKDKAAALAALKAKAAAKKPAAGGASSAASSSPAPAAAAAAGKKEKKVVKKAAAAEPPAESAEEESMKKMEILGNNYWLDVKTNGLYEVGDGDSWGSWVGYYQPGEEEPIRFTDAPEDE